MRIDELVGLVGKDAAKVLSARYGGEEVYIPKWPRETKAEIVEREWKRGCLTPAQIAKLCGCSTRTVYRVLSPN